jgi:hypothetical protein
VMLDRDGALLCHQHQTVNGVGHHIHRAIVKRCVN